MYNLWWSLLLIMFETAICTPHCGGSFILTGSCRILNWGGCIMTKCRGLVSLCITCKIIWGGGKYFIFCNITPCSLVEDNRRFGRRCRLHLQARSHNEAFCFLLHGGLFFGLLFNSKGGGDMFYRNVHWLRWTIRHYRVEERGLHCLDIDWIV
jgi:hypothetical protein